MNTKPPFAPLYPGKKSEVFQAWDFTQPEEASVPEEPDPKRKHAEEYERIKAQAREEGLAQGLKEARESAKIYEQQLTEILQKLHAPMQELESIIAEEMVYTLIHLCRICIGIELSLHPEKIASIWQVVQKQLQSMGEKPVLHLSPTDMQWFEKYRKKIRVENFVDRLQVDEKLGSGDFYLKFQHGDMDGSIFQRLKNIVMAEIGPLNLDNLEQ